MNTLKMIPQFTKMFCSTRFKWSSKVLYSTSSDFKDIIKVEQQNVLTHNIKSVNDTLELMDIISTNGKKMNQMQTMLTLKSLFALQKNGMSSIPSSEIIRNPEFQLLCQKLKSQSRKLELNDIVESLKILAFMGVPSNSNLVMVLLNLVRQQINEITLGHIVFLDFLLRKMETTPLVEALKIAMPILFQIQVNYKMDHENVPQLVDLLQYIAKNKVPEQCTMNVISALTMHGDSIPPDAAKRIIWALCDLRTFSQQHEKLLANVMDIFTRNINQYNFENIDLIITKLIDKHVSFKNNQSPFYNEILLNKSAEYVVESNQGFNNAVYILKKFNKISFVNINILDYVSKLIVLNPSQLERSRPSAVFSFVSAFSIANYITKDWDMIRLALLKNPLFKTDKLEYPWLKFSIDLLSVNCFDEKLIEKLFSNEFLEKFLVREDSILDYIQLLSLYQCTRTLHPEFKYNFPDQKYINRGIELTNNRTEFPLQAVLEYTFGGSNYVKTKVTTKLGHLIDHVILFQTHEGELEFTPITHNNDDTKDGEVIYYENYYTDERKPIPIAIISLPQSAYAKNFLRMKGSTVMKLKALDAIGIKTIPICMKYWYELPEHERIEFIKREIIEALKNT